MKVFKKSDPSKSLTYAAAAQRAIDLGGKFDGHEPPADVNPMTAASVKNLAGTGLVGSAKDNLPLTAQPAAFVASFCQIELDVETGQFDDRRLPRGRRLRHRDPSAWVSRRRSKAARSMGFGLAMFEHHIYDPQNGLPGNACRCTRRSRRPISTSPAELPHRRGRQAGPAEPARHEGHRRARDGRAAPRRCSARSRTRSAATTSTECP